MKKTSLAILLTAIITASAFTSCGNSGASSTGGADSQTAQSSGTTPGNTNSGETPTLIWWQIGPSPDDLSEGMENINNYSAEKVGVKADIKMIDYGDWETKVNTIVNSGEYFDIMFCNYKKYGSFVNLGAFSDITDLLQSESKELWEFVPPEVWKGTEVKGKIYAVPTYKDSSATSYMIWDDTYVQKYNLDINSVKTTADLDKPLRTMKEGEGKGFYPMPMGQGQGPFGANETVYDDLASGLQPMGVEVNDQSRKVVSVLEQDDFLGNLRQMHQWYQDGIINPDAPTLTEVPKQRPFFIAQGFPGAEASWQVTEGVAKYDIVQNGDSRYSTATIQGSLNCVSSNSKYKAEALKLLQFVNLDHKMRDMMAYGIEGKHFDYVKENVVHKLTDTWTMPSYSQATFFTMSTVDDAIENQWVEVQKLNENAKASVCLGFVLDISNISNEMANCKAVWDKYKFELLTGASDPDAKVPECLSELRANGFDTILNEAQKQIDAFFGA